MRNPIIVDISRMRHLRHGGGGVCGSVEDALGKLVTSYFLCKEKIPITHRRRSKYDTGQEIRIVTPESSGVSKIKVPKFSAGKRGTNLGRDVGRVHSPMPTTFWCSW